MRGDGRADGRGRRHARAGSGATAGARHALARLGTTLLAAVGAGFVATGHAAAHDWGTRNRTEAAEVLAGARVNESAVGGAREGGRVAAAANDAGLLPGVNGPVEWALFAFVGLLAAVLAFGLLVAIAKLTYGIVTGTAGWLSRAGSVLPLSEGQVRVAVVAMLAMGAVMFVGVEVQENTTSLWDSEEGAAGRANDLKEQGLKGDPIGTLEADAILTGDSYAGAPYDRPTPDTDGDRLKDAWEERGVTPGGARLPGADPDHKDLYVQVNYGANASVFTRAEKRALVASWAEMPIDNPDGEEGIRLHFVEGETFDTMPTFSSMRSDRNARFYTREYMGPRQCVYHQLIVGDVRMGNVVGIGAVPGYVSVVEADRVNFSESDTSFRVHVTNHELLHNTVGTLPSGGTHTTRGWLKPGPTGADDFLSPGAETVLDERIEGSGYYQNHVCAPGNTTATATTGEGR